jgi:exopolyphosphatase/guanosine-5'-triphosphate,3'-diphosphate pyrophosphatase
VSEEKFQQIKKYIRDTAIRPLQRTREFNYEITIGSSGTIESLVNITHLLFYNPTRSIGKFAKTKDIRNAINHLCSLSLTERSKVRGMTQRRADIIIGGAAILITILDALEIKGIYSTQRTLRDGLLVDYLKRTGHAIMFEMNSVQQRSVMQLAKKCGVDEPHSNHVKKLALGLFECAAKLKLHTLDEAHKQLLGYAAILHDIGIFLSYSDHHKHSYYLIKNADLVGFNQNEISILAAATYFHRKKFPKKTRPQVSGLKKEEINVVKIFATLLRIAEALDRSHQGVIHTARFSPLENGKIYLDIFADEDCQLELWRLNKHNKIFKKTFNCKFIIRVFDTNNNSVPVDTATLDI